MTSERNAQFKIAQERSMTGDPIFWVYKRRGSSGWFGRPEWAPDKFFANFEDAEKYVKDYLEYRKAADQPKMVRFY